MKGRLYLSALVATVAGTGAHAIDLGLLDDFEGSLPMTCVTDDWAVGIQQVPNPPIGVVGCGELESCCLVAQSMGGFGPGSRQVVLNETQWSGDYNAAGVNKIQMQAANASATETINLRVGVTNGVTCYVSTDAVILPPSQPGPGGLVFSSFLLDSSAMTEVSGNNCPTGGDSLTTVLSGVAQLRLLSSVSPSWLGDAIVSVLQVDAIESKSDADLDGINDDLDNCTNAANPNQADSDGDGFGNICDADLNNDCIVNAGDLGLFKSVFFTADPDADFNGDGVVNAIDLGALRVAFFAAPGPGLGACGD